MDVNAKYKRWGRTALAGLAAVVVIAGLVIAVTLARDPKPDGDPITEESKPEYIAGEDEGDKTTDEDQKTEEQKPTESEKPSEENKTPIISDNTEMPKTGAENILPSVFLMAVAATLVAYNLDLKRKA